MNDTSPANPFAVASRREHDRHEKGSAMRLIAEDNDAVEKKSARLKALRLAQEAETAALPPVKKAVKPAAKRAASATKAATAKPAAKAAPAKKKSA